MKALFTTLFLAAGSLAASAQTNPLLNLKPLDSFKPQINITDSSLHKQGASKLPADLSSYFKPVNSFDLTNAVFYNRMPVARMGGDKMPMAVLTPTNDDKMVKRITVINTLDVVGR